MSLITRCPTCETMFRVVPDQLRVSEGWVRCGQCSEVFDATQNMVPPDDGGAAPPAPAPVPSPAASPAPTGASWPARTGSTPATASPGPTASPGATAAAGTWQGKVPAAPQTRTAVPASAPPADWRQPAPEPTPPAPRFDRHGDDDDDARLDHRFAATQDPAWHDADHTDPQTVIEPRDDDNGDRDGAETLPPPELDFPPVPPTTPAADAAPARDEAPAAPPSFLRDDTPPSIWQRPAVRIGLVVALVLLLAALAMQFLVKERDRVAATQPALRPMLEALCTVAGCSIAPLRQIESIVIDSSSFSRVRGDDYRLGFALRNTAPIDVAMPAIELSLTDPQDEPVIRRVILPSEFGARSAALASTSTWTGSLALTVQPELAAQRIAGYRLLAFYP